MIGLFSNNNWNYNEDTKKLIKPGDKVFAISASDFGWQSNNSQELMSEGKYFKEQYKPFRDFGVEIGDFYILNPKDKISFIYDKLHRADLVVLLGGSPYVLMELLTSLYDTNDIKEILESKRVIGISAGAMVLCDYFYITPNVDPEFKHFNKEKGLGIVNDVALLVHYDKNNVKHFINKLWVKIHKPRKSELLTLGNEEYKIYNK